MKHILFVCTGNICRSPMAAAFLNHLVEPKQLPLRATSAGLCPVFVEATDEALLVTKEYGVDLSTHHSRRLNQTMVQDADLILTMTDEQRQEVESGYPVARGKTATLLSFVGGSGDIPDPYAQDMEVYRRCGQHIWAAVEKVVERLGHP